MNPHYTRFLDALAGVPGDPVLFEPFIPVYLTEQLIWRRGEHLWNTVDTYLDTLFSLRERTYADVVIADMRRFGDALAGKMAERMADMATEEIRFTALCGSPLQMQAACGSAGVCAVGLYGWKNWLGAEAFALPAIAMDGDCSAATERGFAGWYCPDGAEESWNTCHGKISILGGLGVDWLKRGQPAAIHERCEDLFRLTKNSGYLVGSGGEVTKEDYLSLISLLGIYRKYR
ncbi:MAG: hypothetical protein IJB15_03320 [Clostridia bacterium]|nr:hypothetical protein [Clostridia bacterium]